ncbi:MAG: hypothetical protein CFE40_13095 [Burkholderiales bacterium PBB1]|nr:MAG: hypothetical protein CFE40_13095 [Burkholderiales bacterium PBB1]
MRIRSRLVLMWLVLALPLQGYAAAAMLNCVAGHHRMSAVVVSSADLPDAGKDRHAHHAHDAEPATALDTHSAAGLSKSKCSACAACCVGAPLPATGLVFAEAAPDGAPACACIIGPIGFLTDGPDRPPRTDLA